MVSKWLLQSSLIVGALGSNLVAANLHGSHANPAQEDCSHDKIHDVIIIGAGWAGISAANHIARHSDSSFLVLESTNRTGGRVEATTLGDSDVVIELGAMWMPGGEVDENYSKEESPLSRLARENNLQCKKNNDLNAPAERPPFFGVGGKNADPDGAIEKATDEAIECIMESAEKGEYKDLLGCGWVARTQTEKSFLKGVTECMVSFDTVEVQTELIWGDARLVVDQNPRGFSSLLDAVIDDIPSHADRRIVFNSRVERVEYDDDVVSVYTNGKKKFRARQVISTIPLGVMQRDHISLFHPPLRKDMKRELAAAEMLHVTKIYMQFPHVWWDNNMDRFAMDDEDLNAWRNMNHQSNIPGSKVLLALASQESSVKLERLDDEQAMELVMKKLRDHFPAFEIPNPSNFLMTRHSLDENRLGAFTGARPNGGADAYSFYEAFSFPLENSAGDTKVWFAGEAHCPSFMGYVHGAMYSGIETAAYLLFENEVGPDPEKMDPSVLMCTNVFEEFCDPNMSVDIS